MIEISEAWVGRVANKCNFKRRGEIEIEGGKRQAEGRRKAPDLISYQAKDGSCPPAIIVVARERGQSKHDQRRERIARRGRIVEPLFRPHNQLFMRLSGKEKATGLFIPELVDHLIRQADRTFKPF